jgi:exodeoxyribonuclease VII small subunit
MTKKNLKFEDSLKRLEEVIETLETGVDELDKIVSLFEEGSELAEICRLKLEKTEKKIEVLSGKFRKSSDEV